MVEAVHVARSFVAGRSRADLDQDRQLLYAVLKAVEIIGEAASKVSLPTRVELSQVPWAGIIGMRNRLIHVYADVNTDIIWDTLAVNLDPLIREVEEALAGDVCG